MRLRSWHFIAASIALSLVALAGEVVCWTAGRGSLAPSESAATAVLVAPQPQRVAPATTRRGR